ncbi:hypothetical protein MTO96_004837 [Rhipicephalus appendiculatus]
MWMMSKRKRLSEARSLLVPPATWPRYVSFIETWTHLLSIEDLYLIPIPAITTDVSAVSHATLVVAYGTLAFLNATKFIVDDICFIEPNITTIFLCIMFFMRSVMNLSMVIWGVIDYGLQRVYAHEVFSALEYLSFLYDSLFWVIHDITI